MKIGQTIRKRNKFVEVVIEKARMDGEIGYYLQAFDITKNPKVRTHYQFTRNLPNITNALEELTYQPK